MRIFVTLGLAILIWIQNTSANTNTSVELADKDDRAMLVELVGRKLKTLWNSYIIQQENKETFVGKVFNFISAK